MINWYGAAQRRMGPNYGTPPKGPLVPEVPPAPGVMTRVSPGTVPMRLRQYGRNNGRPARP
jgi:hypothetical protein